MAHIYAVSPKTPSSADAAAQLTMHSSYEQFTLNMTKIYAEAPLASQATQTVASASNEEAPSRDLRDNATRIYIVHMVSMNIAFALAMFELMAVFSADRPLCCLHGSFWFLWAC